MKGVIMTDASNGFMDTLLRKRRRPQLTGLALSLEKLAVDEIFITGQCALKAPLNDWFERERGRFSTPVTFRFHNDFAEPRKIDPLIRLVRHEGFEDSVVLVSLGGGIPLALNGLKKALYLHPYSPVVGVRKPDHDPAGAVSIGERNRITRFASASERRENEWEPVGLYYFPKRFLLDGMPAFMKSKSVFAPAFESFVSWSVRNFKVYAHVFAAPPGL